MQVYLVGGAVRDELLGLPVKERDWVVVGATREELERLGYRAVGRDFPVFLHPETHEEYALARRERKTAPGYRGFSVEFGPEVTLEEDLSRRDLTVNAMARSADGTLIDPFGGARDIESRTLRHVSAAFVEDPVRVLRVARFAARFAPLGFRVDPATLALMREMVARREVDALVPERVWQESEKALRESGASTFFKVLRESGALARIFPEIDALFGVPQPTRWHPEIDTGVHTLMVLDQAVRLSADARVRFAALVHDLGKGTTPRAEWPAHHGHEERSVALIEALAARLKIPERLSRAGRDRRALPRHRASRLRAQAPHCARVHRARGRVAPSGAFRPGAARLPGRCARPPRPRTQALPAARVSARRPRRGRGDQAERRGDATRPDRRSPSSCTGGASRR